MIAVVLAVVIALVQVRLAVGQGRILGRFDRLTQEMRRSQLILMELEVMEKVGAIERGAQELSTGSVHCGPTVENDSAPF